MNQDLKDHFLNVFQPFWRVSLCWRTWSLLALVCCCLTACRDDDAIRIYTAPKESSLGASGMRSRSGPTEPQELLGALIAKENRPWAFKMVGSPEKVAQYKGEFRQLVDSFNFSEDGQPKWQLPDSWREEPGNEFTFRTFRPPNESSVKATVSELAYSFNPTDLDVSKWHDYVAQNVNRWRGQLSLEDQAWDEMSSDLEPIEKLSLRDIPAYYVTLRGEAASMSGGPMSGGPMSGGPMSGGPMSGGFGPAPTAPAETNAADDNLPTPDQLQVVLPEGWRAVAPLSTMAWKSFEADGPEGTKVQVTLTPAGGDSVSNVVRWAGQIGGSEAQASAAIDAVEKFAVNDKPTELYKIVGPEPDPKATTAAIVRWTGKYALFVKMTGPAAAVNSQNEAFVSMLKSIKW